MNATADMDVATFPGLSEALVSLPADLAACHAMIGQLLAGQRDQSRTIRQLEHQLHELLRKLYGRSSEKLDANQLTLFAEMLGQLQSQQPAPPTPAPQPPSAATASKPVKTPHGRRRFPEDLPRDRKEHDLPEDQKACPCCGKMRCKI
ncbi:MAG TPA: transposase, partial [Tepidisphaeraceae bacterium]|nr:transposase [Tepidisphaeraceae bacterium]